MGSAIGVVWVAIPPNTNWPPADVLSWPISPCSAPCAVAARPVVEAPVLCALVSVAERLCALDSIEVSAESIADKRVAATALACV